MLPAMNSLSFRLTRTDAVASANLIHTSTSRSLSPRSLRVWRKRAPLRSARGWCIKITTIPFGIEMADYYKATSAGLAWLRRRLGLIGLFFVEVQC